LAGIRVTEFLIVTKILDFRPITRSGSAPAGGAARVEIIEFVQHILPVNVAVSCVAGSTFGRRSGTGFATLRARETVPAAISISV